MFRHRLALQIGCTVAELNARISSSELTRWMAFYEMDPWGSWRDNFHFARLCALYANSHSRKGDDFKVQDFMYEDPDETHEKKQIAIRDALLALAGGSE